MWEQLDYAAWIAGVAIVVLFLGAKNIRALLSFMSHEGAQMYINGEEGVTSRNADHEDHKKFKELKCIS